NARDNAASIPSVTKLNVVPPRITKGGREWRVSTNTGWWYGGSSPHQPFHSSPHWRHSAEFLGEPDEKASGPADIADPIRVFVLNHFAADEPRPLFSEPGRPP